jgi:hypothetical protein
MPVKAIYSDKAKPAWTYDYKKKMWRGFLLDCFKYDGAGKPLKRIRIKYARREAAEAAILEIEIEKQNARAGVQSPKHRKEVFLKELFDARLPAITNKAERTLAKGFLVRFSRFFCLMCW